MTTTPFDPNRSVASLTIAELEAFVRQTVEQAQKSQSPSLIPPETNLESSFDSSAPPLWEIISESAAQIPDEIWATIPEDASQS